MYKRKKKGGIFFEAPEFDQKSIWDTNYFNFVLPMNTIALFFFLLAEKVGGRYSVMVPLTK